MVEFSKEEIKTIAKEVQFSIGGRIKAIRESKGITQTQLASCIHSDRQYMYRIESGKVGVSLAKLAVIAKAMEVPLVSLVQF